MLVIKPKISVANLCGIPKYFRIEVETQTETDQPIVTTEHGMDKIVSVKQDKEKEFIEIDFDKLEIDKLYIVDYQNESYAVKRVSDHNFAFYDVI